MNEDVPNLTDCVTDPKVDIRYTNGHVTGKFTFRFKQHIFNWMITAIVSACGIHGVYLHYYQEDLEKQIKEQQSMLTESYKREAAVEEALKAAQLLLTRCAAK
jgi:hypothetical protein